MKRNEMAKDREIKYRLRIRGKIVGYEKWHPDAFEHGIWIYSKDNSCWDHKYIPHFDKDQFTGLCDKNGKEEYEKDIVEFVHHNGLWRGVVEYVSDGAKIAAFVYVKSRRIDKKINLDPIRIPLYEIERWLTGVSEEVIGNIYENPELL